MEKIREEIEEQKIELLKRGIEPEYLILDNKTYRNLLLDMASYIGVSFSPINVASYTGLKIAIVNTDKKEIRVK